SVETSDPLATLAGLSPQRDDAECRVEAFDGSDYRTAIPYFRLVPGRGDLEIRGPENPLPVRLMIYAEKVADYGVDLACFGGVFPLKVNPLPAHRLRYSFHNWNRELRMWELASPARLLKGTGKLGVLTATDGSRRCAAHLMDRLASALPDRDGAL